MYLLRNSQNEPCWKQGTNSGLWKVMQFCLLLFIQITIHMTNYAGNETQKCFDCQILSVWDTCLSSALLVINQDLLSLKMYFVQVKWTHVPRSNAITWWKSISNTCIVNPVHEPLLQLNTAWKLFAQIKFLFEWFHN